jgi:hypothetical protein
VGEGLRERLRVGLIPDVPGGDARQRRERDAGTRIGHPSESKIDAIGKNGCERQRTIRYRVPGAEIGEVPPEVASAIHFRKQIGDLDPWHKPTGLTGQQLRYIRLLIVERRDLQHAIMEASGNSLAWASRSTRSNSA